MSPSVTPILLGEDYQHLYFWIQAARLFMEDDPAEIVFIEHPIIQAFDDVVAVNRVPLYSHDNRLIEVDHYQLKYHVDGRETIRALDLSTPSFIGATKHSLLDKAYAATKNGDIPKRLTLVTAWRFDPHDILRTLISNNDGEIVTPKLFVDGPNSEVGKVREAWRAQLGGVTDDELERVLRHLRIRDNVPLYRLKQDLAFALALAGFAPPSEGELDNPYVSIVRRFIQGGPREHRATSLRPFLEKAKLWRGRPLRAEADPRDIAIKSFSRGAINLEDHAATLNLVPDLPRPVQGRGGRLGSRPRSSYPLVPRRTDQREPYVQPVPRRTPLDRLPGRPPTREERHRGPRPERWSGGLAPDGRGSCGRAVDGLRGAAW